MSASIDAATAEEVAAVVAVLAAASADDAAPRVSPRASAWVSRDRLVRAATPHGPGGWRASALPR